MSPGQFLFLLFTTTSPGLQRLLLFGVVDHYFGLQRLGQLSSDLAICIVLGNFTAIGWTNIVMTTSRTDPVQFDRQFLDVALRALLSLVWCTLLLGLLHRFDVLFVFGGSVLALAGWSAYQLVRAYFIAQQRYRLLSLVEVAILTAIVVFPLLLPWLRMRPHLVFAAPLLLVPGGLILALARRTTRIKSRLTLADFCQPYEFGLSNLASSSPLLMLVPFTMHFLDADYAGGVSLLLSGLALIYLVPRACGFFFVPGLAAFFQADDQASLRRARRQFRIWVGAYLVLAAALLIGAWILLTGRGLHSLFELPSIGTTFFLLATAHAVSQVVLPDASILIAGRASRAILNINLVALAAFVLVCILFLIGIEAQTAAYLRYLAVFAGIVTLRGIMTVRKAGALIQSVQVARADASQH